MTDNSSSSAVNNDRNEEEDNPNKKSKAKNVSVWDYFLREGDTAKCTSKNCLKVLKCVGGNTSGLHRHLKSQHNIDLLKSVHCDLQPGNEKVAPKRSESISKHFIKKEKNLTETLARMTSKDGIPFSVFITSKDLREALRSNGFADVPQSAVTIKTMVVNYSKMLREKEKADILQLKFQNQKFSLTFDEWTSNRNRRYMNLILHGESAKIWNLGLVRMLGSMPAEKCLQLVETKLEEYNLTLKNDIVSIITDGTSVMTKIGRLSPSHQQLCFAHGVQLAVLDVLYKKYISHAEPEPSQNENFDNNSENENSESDSDSEENDFVCSDSEEASHKVGFSENIKPIIDKVRKIVKMFKKSPLKNEVLQKYVKGDFGNESCLLLDSKTRWSSLVIMMERFFTLKNCIKKALVDVSPEMKVEEWELERIADVIQALKPVQATVEALCRRDANLITADAAIVFTLKKLKEQNSPMSLELYQALKLRVSLRRTDSSDILQYLHTGKYYSDDDEDINLFGTPNFLTVAAKLKELLSRLTTTMVQTPVEDSQEAASTSTGIHQNKKRKKKDDLHEELDLALETALSSNHVEKTQPVKSLLTTIKLEMKLFEAGGIRGIHLSVAYRYLMGIVPTSVESERAFSSSGYLCNKIRSSFKDDTLDHLCFLRFFFQNEN